jgi:hypothetical protein
MKAYEKLGAFYLGKLYDMPSQQLRDDIVLYEYPCSHYRYDGKR